jgi:hypothetical protein
MHNDCVDKFKVMRQELRNELQSLNSQICLTSDLWTSNQKLGYICLTVHYIGTNFVLKKKLLLSKKSSIQTRVLQSRRQLQDISSSGG